MYLQDLLVPIVLAGSLVAFVTFMVLRSAARRRAVAAAASGLGLSYQASGSRDLAKRLRAWRVPANASLVSVVQGALQGTSVSIGTFNPPPRKEGSGRKRSFEATTVVGIPYAGPRFSVIPASREEREQMAADLAQLNAIPGLKALVGSAPLPTPVAFNGLSQFGESHTVCGDDAEAIQAALSEPLQRFCLEHPEFELESTGEQLLFFRGNVRAEPDDYRRLVDAARKLAQAVR